VAAIPFFWRSSVKKASFVVMASLLAAVAAAQMGAAPSPAPASSPAPAAKAGPVTRAVAVLTPAKDGKVEGTLTFATASPGLKVTGRITGLAAGTHGFHIHEFGDCSAADFSSAGGHYNPTGHPHAGPAEARRHIGDMGNIEAGADGSATVDYTDPRLRLEGAHGILGRGVIVHASADDLKTQPTGNAGGRLACGVIGVAKAE
jgi:Cu-Zn family superoxide dismutase